MPGCRISVALPVLVRPSGFRSYVVSGKDIVGIRGEQCVHLLQDLGIKVGLRYDFGASGNLET